jgi:mannosyltransferase OCH1-like enzyme
MIPKKLHYCWFGRSRKSALNKRCIETWHKVLPDFEIKEWNETNAPLDDVYCKASYAKGMWSRLSNHVRMYALYSEGGIYLDTDVEVVKSFAPLLRHECFLGFQQEQESVDWANSAVLGAVSGHKFLEECIDVTREKFLETGEFFRSPTIVTNILRDMGLTEYGYQEIEEVTIYPAECFYPYPWFGKFSPECITENTYCIHHWEGSWTHKRFDRLRSPLRALKRMLTLVPRVEG